MNTGIYDCGRLRQISFQVATAVLGQRSFAVLLHTKTRLGEGRNDERKYSIFIT